MTKTSDPGMIAFTGSRLEGVSVSRHTTTIADVGNIFLDVEGMGGMSQHQIVYEVDLYEPVDPGTPGGLFFGVTRIYPGQVGKEYFMTRGHFHALRDRSEFYWGVEGRGMLILMDEKRNVRLEEMRPGSLHYIPACTAHRVANTGQEMLSFGACWPADAGHDYDEIAQKGFAARLMEVGGIPELIAER